MTIIVRGNAQRVKRYNPSTRPRQLKKLKRYAELIRNYKKQKIKNFYDNKLIIDADYYNNESNEGEIFFQVINLSPVDIQIKKGDKICQGIIKTYEITSDERKSQYIYETRRGGFGSTSKHGGAYEIVDLIPEPKE